MRVGLTRSAADTFRTDVKSNTDIKRELQEAGLGREPTTLTRRAPQTDKVPLRASRLFIRTGYAVQVETILSDTKK